MKKKVLILLLVVCSTFIVNAQSAENYLHYPKQIDSIVGVSQDQKKLIEEALNKANWLWDYANTRYGSLDQDLKNNFIAYHFYVYAKDAQLTSVSEIKNLEVELAKKESLRQLIKKLARRMSQQNCESNALVVQQEEGLIKIVKRIVAKEIAKDLRVKRKSYQSFINLNAPEKTYEQIQAIVEVEKEKYLNDQKEVFYAKLVKKAQKLGLDKPRIDELIRLIKQKEEDVAEIYRRKNEVSSASLFEVTTEKTHSEISLEFSKNVAKLITKKEFAKILGGDLKPASIKNAQKDIEEVFAIYELNEEQKEAVSKKIKSYYFKEIIIKHYYRYNWELQNQKLGGLRYNFEKDFKEMMDKFNVAVKPTTKANNNTFQY